MNSELKVGMPAMIVGCLNPENSYKIGKVVELVYCIPISDFTILPKEFLIEGINVAGPLDNESWIVKGVDSHSEIYKEGYACFAAKHLMPLPPLDDDAKLLDTETPKETSYV